MVKLDYSAFWMSLHLGRPRFGRNIFHLSNNLGGPFARAVTVSQVWT